MNRSLLKFSGILFLSLIITSSSIFAANKQEKKETADSAKIQATALINSLKQGALLVKLKTSENLINKLTERGRIKEAEELKARQHKENLEVYKAFKEKYKFGPVYYFYSSKTNNVKQRKFEGILLDSALTPDSSITINNKTFYVAEIGDIQSETTNSTRHGLRVMNSEMEEIDFEKYTYLQSVWQVDLLKLKLRNPADMVETFDKRLHKVAEKL